MDHQTRLATYADLIVQIGANVQPGQLVAVTAEIGGAPLARAVAEAAYRAGASVVAPRYDDLYFTRATVELGPESALSWTPPWDLEFLATLEREQAAYIKLKGGPPPGLLDDLDPARAGRARPEEYVGTWSRLVSLPAVNWTIAAQPSPEWAEKVFGEPDVERLWTEVGHAVRLDEADPIDAWRRHIRRLRDIAAWLNRLQLDALRYRGPGTDLTVGLLPGSRFVAAQGNTTFGVEFCPNLPTEEVFTSPDPHRAEGHIRLTRPLQLSDQQVIEGLSFELRGGRITRVEGGGAAADAARAHLATDDTASRLGELALVDGSSRVGESAITFHNTLFDENATSHIAYGHGFGFAVEGDDEPNESHVHQDFMVGGPEVEISGVARDGREIPIIRGNFFQLD